MVPITTGGIILNRWAGTTENAEESIEEGDGYEGYVERENEDWLVGPDELGTVSRIVTGVDPFETGGSGDNRPDPDTIMLGIVLFACLLAIGAAWVIA